MSVHTNEMRNASKFLDQNLDKDFESMSKATEKIVSYAKTIKPKYSCNCVLCGTTENVDQIQFGINISNTINALYLCPKCRTWLGEYLVSDNTNSVMKLIDLE